MTNLHIFHISYRITVLSVRWIKMIVVTLFGKNTTCRSQTGDMCVKYRARVGPASYLF